MKPRAMPREWLVVMAASLALLFGTGTTFPSMGIPLFAMAQEFHWSEAGAGSAFLTLGIVASAMSLSPMVLIPRIGARWTLAAGMLLLAAGFFLASTVTTLLTFYIATAVFGAAFAMVVNALGIYLIAGWFGARAGPIIGLYLMLGNLGGAVIPPIAGALTASHGGWRLYWQVLGLAALVVAAVCALLVREPPTGAATSDTSDTKTGGERKGWGYRTFLPTSQFLTVSAAMVWTQACIIVVAAVATPHLAQHGRSAQFASQILGFQGLVGMIGTGVSGWLTERWDPRRILAFALASEAAALALFAFAQDGWMIYAFAVLFGIGWSMTTLAGTVILIRYFGDRGGTAAQSAVWTVAGLSTVGPYLAGLVADRTGSFAPSLIFLAVLLVPIAFASVAMKVRRVENDRTL